MLIEKEQDMRQFAIRYGVIKLDVKRKRNKMFSTSLLAHIYRRGNVIQHKSGKMWMSITVL